VLTARWIVYGMNRRGDCYDNAVMESDGVVREGRRARRVPETVLVIVAEIDRVDVVIRIFVAVLYAHNPVGV
jgi:hypothetical protein